MPGLGAPPHGAGAPTANGAAGMVAGASAAGVQAAPEISVVSHPGNLYGLLERTTAVESLLAVAAELQAARGALAAALPPADLPALDTFFSRTMGAAEDLQDFVIRTGGQAPGRSWEHQQQPLRLQLLTGTQQCMQWSSRLPATCLP